MFGEKSSVLVQELMEGSNDLETIDDPKQAQIPGETKKSMDSMRKAAMKRMTGETEEVQGIDSLAEEDRGVSSGFMPKNDGSITYHPGMTLLRQVSLEFLKSRDLGPITKVDIDDQIELARYFLKQTEPKQIPKVPESKD